MRSRTRSVWEPRSRILIPSYVERNAIRRAFMSVSSAYGQCLPSSTGAPEEWRYVPQFDRAHDPATAMRVVPERIGAAVTSLLASNLDPGST